MHAKSNDPAVAQPAARRNPCAAEMHGDYLKLLGDRVRSARARRGMTRKILARDSGVSERYLAQLESGQGNISIALLRQVAQAMSLPIVELVREGEEPPLDYTLLARRLARMSPAELKDAAELIAGRFGRDTDPYRTARIALIGLRGAGKTTLGRGLGERLGVPFVEMAAEIERDSGMSLDEIFDLSGQAGYRRYERRALERVLAQHSRVVIASGGSLVSEPATYELLLNGCFTVWVQASPEEHMNRVLAQGDTRPMAGNSEAMADLQRILDGRQALYSKADAVVNTTGKTVDQALNEVTALIRRQNNGASAHAK